MVKEIKKFVKVNQFKTLSVNVTWTISPSLSFFSERLVNSKYLFPFLTVHPKKQISIIIDYEILIFHHGNYYLSHSGKKKTSHTKSKSKISLFSHHFPISIRNITATMNHNNFRCRGGSLFRFNIWEWKMNRIL